MLGFIRVALGEDGSFQEVLTVVGGSWQVYDYPWQVVFSFLALVLPPRKREVVELNWCFNSRVATSFDFANKTHTVTYRYKHGKVIKQHRKYPNVGNTLSLCESC